MSIQGFPGLPRARACVLFVACQLALSYCEDGTGSSNWHLMFFLDPVSDRALAFDVLSIFTQESICTLSQLSAHLSRAEWTFPRSMILLRASLLSNGKSSLIPYQGTVREQEDLGSSPFLVATQVAWVRLLSLPPPLLSVYLSSAVVKIFFPVVGDSG